MATVWVRAMVSMFVALRIISSFIFTIMKVKINLVTFVVTIVFSMLFISLKSYALDYNISFTGIGASNTVDSVIVQNLTKGTMVTIPSGNVLNLSYIPNAIDQLIEKEQSIIIYQCRLVSNYS